MTIMQDEHITVAFRPWDSEQTDDEHFRSVCVCGWRGPDATRRADAYIDWERHMISSHMPSRTSCPAWCQQPSGHPWTVGDPGPVTWFRDHKRQFGPVSIEQMERLTSDGATLGEPGIETNTFEIWEGTPEEADEFAACLAAASSYLRGLLAVTA